MNSKGKQPTVLEPSELATYPAAIRTLETIEIEAQAGRQQLTLQRISPKSATCMGLEYHSAAGQVVAGQWLGEPDAFCTVLAETQTQASEALCSRPELGLLLQTGGADRRLVGLASLVSQPEAKLLVHRPERRAVVHLHGSAGDCFAKVVPPRRIAALATTLHQVAALAGGQFATPHVLESNLAKGILWMSPLAGTSLYELLGTSEFVEAAALAGQTLRRLHQLALPSQVATHSAADEVQVLERWLGWLALLSPIFAEQLRLQRAAVYQALQGSASPAVLLHRDFFDKQLLISRAGAVSLLDFDTLARGEAALDLANALVHFELRARQQQISWQQARTASARFLTAYAPAPAVQQRIRAYANATRLRLACVYACRPAARTISQHLLASIGSPLLYED